MYPKHGLYHDIVRLHTLSRSSLCINKFVDDGCIAGSALAVNSSYLATGSSEGVVNIYNLAKIDKPNPIPDKVTKLFYMIPRSSFTSF